MAAIRCVAFDFDGTLVDSNRIKEDTFYTVVADLQGGGALMQRVKRDQPGDRFHIFERFAEEWNREHASAPHRVTAASLVESYTACCEDAIASGLDFPGAAALLEGLSARGIQTALISATPAVPLNAVIARKNWHLHFGWVISATDKAEGLRTLSEMTGQPPSAIAMVGDREVDRQGAMRFGCTFIGVRRGDNDFMAAPELMVDHLTDVLSFIEQAGR